MERLFGRHGGPGRTTPVAAHGVSGSSHSGDSAVCLCNTNGTQTPSQRFRTNAPMVRSEENRLRGGERAGHGACRATRVGTRRARGKQRRSLLSDPHPLEHRLSCPQRHYLLRPHLASARGTDAATREKPFPSLRTGGAPSACPPQEKGTKGEGRDLTNRRPLLERSRHTRRRRAMSRQVWCQRVLPTRSASGCISAVLHVASRQPKPQLCWIVVNSE